MMLAGPPRLLSILSVFFVIFIGAWYLRLSSTKGSTLKASSSWASANPNRDPLDFSVPLRFQDGVAKPPGSNYSHILVVPRAKDEDIAWMHRELSETPKTIYEVGDPNAKYHVPKNKGREAMVYLTYIIDHYDELPEIIIFAHSHHYAWHNNMLMSLDTVQLVKRLNHDRVARMGYMNLRCHHDPGCPDWIHMDRPAADFDFYKKPEEIYWRRQVWEELHPGAPVPQSLSGICCAQFAVSQDRIRQVPLERFKHYRNWLLNTSMDDQFSGRIFEYIWHYMFTGHANYCPAMNTCYCDGYGFCFGGKANFTAFMTQMEKRNELAEELAGYQNQENERIADQGRDYKTPQELKDKMRELEKVTRTMDVHLEAQRAAALKRGEDPANRLMETETYDDTHIWDNVPEGD